MNLLVSRYAEPFYQAAKEAGEVDHVRADLERLASAWHSAEFAEFVRSPQISNADKLEVIQKLLPDASKLTINFLKLVYERGRSSVLNEIPEEFLKRYRKDQGIVSALVTSAVTLTDEEKVSLSRRLGERLKKTVELTVSIDPSLIGGMIVEIEGKRFDGSILRRLDSLKHAMLS